MGRIYNISMSYYFMVFNLFESMDDITQYITQSGLNFALAYTFREIYPIIPGIKYEMYKEGNKK
jgi:hypothetical protein